MRVTNNAMTRNYLINLNNNLSLLNESGTRLQTGREFTKMSENVSAGTRALGIRTQMYKNEQIQSNVKKASESLTVAESNMMSLEDILNSVHEQTIKALNGTNDSVSNIFSAITSSLKQTAFLYIIYCSIDENPIPFTSNCDIYQLLKYPFSSSGL